MLLKRPLQIYFTLGLVICTVAYSPEINFESVALPKMLTLSMFVFSILPLIILQKTKDKFPFGNLASGIAIVYLLTLILVFFTSGSNQSQQFYGVFGRNFGLLTQACLLVLFLIIVNLNLYKIVELNFLYYACCIIIALSLVFGLVQVLTLNEDYLLTGPSKYTAFFGNSNFFSSILAILITFPLIYLRTSNNKRLLAVNFSLVATAVFMIIKIGDLQGIFLLLISVFFIVGMRIYAANFYVFLGYSFTILVSGFFLLVGTFGVGPLGNSLVQQSNLFRLDYYRSALSVGKANLISGAGIESFIDTYTQGRDQEAFNRRNTVLVDSPHNYFIDQFASGGVMLLLLPLVLVFAVLLKIFRSFKNLEISDNLKMAIILAWICSFSSLMVNPSNISVHFWFWLLSGAILNRGFTFHEIREPHISTGIKHLPSKTAHKRNVSKFLTYAIAGSIVGLAVVYPEFKADLQLRQGLDTGDKKLLTSSAMNSPYQQNRLVLVASVFLDNRLVPEAMTILETATFKNPDCLRCWKLRLEQEKDPRMVLKIKSEISRLDPVGNSGRQQ